MVKLQIGENTVTLNAKEEDLFFELLDKNYDTIRNSPTFNAIYNWMKEDHDLSKETVEHLQKIPTAPEKEVVNDPWSNNTTMEEKAKANGEKWKQYQENKDYDALRKLLADLLKQDIDDGYYIAL